MNIKCATVLKDHPGVLAQSKKYPNLSDIPYPKFDVPKTFNGLDVWKDLITFVPNNFGYASWAYITKEMFILRLNISAYHSFYVPSLSQYEMLLMIDKPQFKADPSCLSFSKQEQNIYEGYSIYDALEYCYLYGFPLMNNFNDELLQENNINLLTIKTFDEKIEIVKKNKELLDRSHCIRKINDKYVARRVFRLDAIVNVGLGTDESLEDDIKSIQKDLFGFGPLMTGFLVYDDFLNSYDGKSIYTGPSPGSKPVGGHALGLLGWGEDPKDGRYWITLFGTGGGWGLFGVCKIKMGIKECMLEKNVITIMPELPNNYLPPNTMMKNIDPTLASKRIYIDPLTFYTDETTSLLQKGVIVSEGTARGLGIQKLIENPNDMFYIFNLAGNLNIYDSVKDLQYRLPQECPVNIYVVALTIVSMILLVFISSRLFVS